MTNGNGNGHGARPPAGTAGSMPDLATLAAPARLTAALSVTGELATALRMLKQAGYPVSITGGRNDVPEDGDGLYAAHPVNVSAAGFSASLSSTPGHEQCCATRPRGVYQGSRLAGRIPYVHARVITPEGRSESADFLMSAAPGGARVRVTPDEIDNGRYAHRLRMPRSADPRIRHALDTVACELAYGSDVPEVPAALTPASRDDHGRIPVTEFTRDVMPPGWLDQPPAPADDPGRAAARRVKAEIAARRPQVALSYGASAAAPYCGALHVQSHIWELAAGARIGKTTTVNLMASTWGAPAQPPDPGLVTSWDATAKGPGRLLGMLGIFPSFMDETGTAEFESSQWGRLVYSIAQGASRLTADSRGPGIRKTPGWQGVLFISGNQTITTGNRNGRFAGVPARVITLAGPFTGSADECDELAAAVRADYGHDGPAVLAAVDVDTMGQWQRAALAEIGAPDGGTLGTNAAQLALAVAGAMALDHIHGTPGTIAAAALTAARGYLGTASEPQSDREVFLAALAERLSSNPAAWATAEHRDLWTKPAGESVPGYSPPRLPLHGLQTTLDGLLDDEWVYLYPQAFRLITGEHGLSDNVMLAEMHDRGDLHVTESWRAKGEWKTPGPRWAGRPSVYKVRRAAVDATADDDTAPDEPTDPAPVVDPPATEPADPLAGGWGPGTIGGAARGEDHQAAPLFVPPVTNTPQGANEHPGGPRRQDHAATPTRPVLASVRERRPADAGQEQAPGTRAGWLAATFARPDNRDYFRTQEQRAALDRITALIDENPDPADKNAINDLTNRLKLADELQGYAGQPAGGPFCPSRRGYGKARLSPWTKNKGNMPIVIDMALDIEGYSFRRDYTGPVVRLDANGMWIGALGNAEVAWGMLHHTGEKTLAEVAKMGGYAKVEVPGQAVPGMPFPLAHARPGTGVWVPTPIAGLLAELYEAGRWPYEYAVDSWTGVDPNNGNSITVRLNAIGRLVREDRRYGLERYGYGTGAYQVTKDSVSKMISMWGGTLAGDTTRPVREWNYGRNTRADWRHAVRTGATAQMWRTLDRCMEMADGDPALMPVELTAKDTLVIPAAAFDLFTTQNYPRGDRPPIRIDQTGVTLGTFKVKAGEDS